jgi:DNA-binding MarR family transcriptional regulator
MLNVSDTLSKLDQAAEASGTHASDAPTRQALQHELIEEMTAWSPRDREGAFKSWHRHSLSLIHLNVLTSLEVEGPVPMKRLAETLDVSDASVTGIVDRMEKRGLVERSRGAGDRRVILVRPTETGIRVFKEMGSHRREMLGRVLDELTEEQISGLLVGMRAIHAARRRVLAASEAGTSPEPPPAEPPPAEPPPV